MNTCQPAGNFYGEYNTRNPVARHLIQEFLGAFESLWKKTGAKQAVEVGCGEGKLSMCLAASGMQVRGFDIASDAIAEARKRAKAANLNIEFAAMSIQQMSDIAPSPLVVCCEVLEHPDETDASLEALERLTSDWLLVNVPREPVWRVLNMARGKYIGQFGSTPGHVNHWSRSTFPRLDQTRFEVIEQRTPLPWAMEP